MGDIFCLWNFVSHLSAKTLFRQLNFSICLILTTPICNSHLVLSLSLTAIQSAFSQLRVSPLFSLSFTNLSTSFCSRHNFFINVHTVAVYFYSDRYNQCPGDRKRHRACGGGNRHNTCSFSSNKMESLKNLDNFICISELIIW